MSFVMGLYVISINRNIAILLLLILEENIMCVLLCTHYFQMLKEKVYSLREKLDQLSNTVIGFVLALLLLVETYSTKISA